MCIIVDTNTLASVFNQDSTNHSEFKPVFDWIIDGKGVVVYGGSKYIRELGKYRRLFAELTTARQAVLIDNAKVDEATDLAASKVQHVDFDDPHLVGLLMVSGCKLICSLDSRAYPFFRHLAFFSPAGKKPKIYRGKTNADLLADKNIAEICKPCAPTTKQQKQGLIFLQALNK